ncbi:MAG: TonB-dependent receptor, partial [Gemmatimonadetes bacterium]|nr:TonB-dependent receptor [Gemmatimonadota bacterium]
MRRLQRTRALAACAGALWITATPGLGQEAADTVVIQPVSVTVLRTPTRLDRAPFSASVLSGAELQGGTTGLFIQEALQALPGVRIQNRFNPAVGERISIRGFGARAQFGVRGIKILVDGIPATLPDGQSTLDHLDLGSLGRVEALRGPAAALYGNAAGGVLQFESERPFSGRYRQQATAVVGSDGLLRLQATGSGTSGGAGYRISVGRTSYDGFRTNEGASPDPYSGGDRTTLNGTLELPLSTGRLNLQLIGLDMDALNPGSLPGDLFAEGSNQAWGFNVAQGTFKAVRQGQVGLRWSGPVGGLEGTVSGYAVRRELDNPIPNTVIDLDRNAGGLRVSAAREWPSSRGPIRLDVGVEGELQSDARQNFENEGGGTAGSLTLDQDERVRSAGVFAQLYAPLSTRLTLLGALRYEDVAFTATDNFTTAGDPDDSGERSMSGLNPSIGAHLSLGAHGVFVSVARSFETPTTTELANRESGAGGLNPALDPQRGWSVEGGVRGTLGGRIAYDVAAFSTWLTGQLIPFEVASAPGRRFFRNTGESTVQGLEASARAVLTPGLSLLSTYSWVDARFEDFVQDGEDLSGNRIPGIAPHRVDLRLRGEVGAVYGEVRLERRGSVPVDDSNESEAEGHTLLDLRVG